MAKPSSAKPKLIRKGLATPRQGSLQPLRDRTKLDAIMDAISSINLIKTEAWNDMHKLSAHIRPVEIEAVPEGVFEIDKGGFAAAATVYVDVSDEESGKSFFATDSFPAEVHGHLEPDGTAVVESLSVDTSSFSG